MCQFYTSLLPSFTESSELKTEAKNALPLRGVKTQEIQLYQHLDPRRSSIFLLPDIRIRCPQRVPSHEVAGYV